MKISIEQTQKFTKKQCEIFDACAREDVDYVVVSCGRQTGKTTVGIWQSVKWCLNKPSTIGYFLPTYSQCKNIFDRFKKVLTPMIKAKKCSFVGSPAFEITFWNGSVIKLKTANNDNFRGQTFDYMIVDEACFIKNDIFNVMMPCVAVSLSKPIGQRGKILMVSTPKTKNWFYGYVKSERSNVKVIRFTSLEGGTYTKELLDDLRAMTPEHIFRNEYEGEFLDSGLGMFKYIDCIQKPEISSIQTQKIGHIAAIDIGSMDDYTVLTILDKQSNVIHISKYRHQDYEVILDSVMIELKKFKSPLTYIETNGVGIFPFQYLQKRYKNVKDWCTTNANKADIIHGLMVGFNTKQLSIPDNEDLKGELDNFSCSWVNGKPHFQGDNNFHDDMVISLAIAFANRDKISSTTATTIKNTRSNAI